VALPENKIINRILVIAPSWVGDTMLIHPMLVRLKQRHPDCIIEVLAPSWTEDLLRQMPEVTNTITNPFEHGSLQLGARIKLGMQLRNKNFDQAIVLPNSLKSALVPFFAGIAIRTGFVGEMRYGLLNDVRKLDKHALPLMVERFAQLAEAPNDAISRPLPEPRLQVSEEQKQHTLDKFGLTLDKPVAIFCPGAEFGPAKRWPISYFAELAQRLQQQGYAVWIIGSSKDKEIGDKIVALGNLNTQNLCGSTDLSDAVALISTAALVVSNDSGLMHIAAALDRPMLALYGSSSPAFTPPLSRHAEILKIDIPCSPCFKRECPLKHFKCMVNLTPQMVAEHIPALPKQKAQSI
jgi:heptosyltransferase-2